MFFSALDWPHEIRVISDNVGRYDNASKTFVAGSTAAATITGHKTIIRQGAASQHQAGFEGGEILDGDVVFGSTAVINRDAILEFDENEDGTIVTRYRVEQIGHRHGLMTRFTQAAQRTVYLLREVQDDGN